MSRKMEKLKEKRTKTITIEISPRESYSRGVLHAKITSNGKEIGPYEAMGLLSSILKGLTSTCTIYPITKDSE